MTKVFLGWGPVVRSAQWVAVGTVARPTDEGFFFVTGEPLVGAPPAEQFVPRKTAQPVTEGTRVIAWAEKRFPESVLLRTRDGDPEFSDSEWFKQVSFVVKNYARLEAASNPDDGMSALRVLIASGYRDALVAVRRFGQEESEAKGIDVHMLLPELVRVISLTPSASAAKEALSILMPLARPEDVPAVLAVLERPDPEFRAEALAWMDRMTSPKPPPIELPAGATKAELGRALDKRRAWYEENKHELTWRGQCRADATGKRCLIIKRAEAANSRKAPPPAPSSTDIE